MATGSRTRGEQLGNCPPKFSKTCLVVRYNAKVKAGFLRRFRDPIRVPRISNRVPRIRENYDRVPKIRENRIPRIREIGSLQIHAGYQTFALKKNLAEVYHYDRQHCDNFLFSSLKLNL